MNTQKYLDKYPSWPERVNWILTSSTYDLGPTTSPSRGEDLSALRDPDNECKHGRCPGDKTPPCGCHHPEIEERLGRTLSREWALAIDNSVSSLSAGEAARGIALHPSEPLRTALCACGCGARVDRTWPKNRIYTPECSERIRAESMRAANRRSRQRKKEQAA